jgi:hypothetical protein
MWKIVAVFLLMLVLAIVSALNKEGLSWMLTLFFAMLGVGIFIYAYGMYKNARKSNTQIKQIKSEMGEITFKKEVEGIKQEIAPQIPDSKIEVPKISEPEHPADAAEHNEIHITAIETPPVEPIKVTPNPETASQIANANQPEAQADDLNKNPDEATVSLDLAKLRMKIKSKDD